MKETSEVSGFVRSSVFNKWIVPGAIYVALASGAGNPIRCHESSCDSSAAYLTITALLVLIIPFVRGSGRVLLQLIVLGFGFLILSVIGYASQMPLFVYSKAWGAFLASGFIVIYMVHLLLHGGVMGFAQGLARIMFMVLSLTLLFKASQGGVMDRDVSYLLNGPIVFGWLMGIGALCSVYIFIIKRELIYSLIAICLSLGVLWSGSKGPIFAYFLSAIFLCIVIEGFAFGKLKRIWIFLAAAVIAIFLVISVEYFSDSRLGLLLNIYENGIDYSEGSVGVRLAAYESSVELILENLLNGIGSGGFAKYQPDLMYPHNLHLEILLEYGLIIFAAYAALLFYGVVNGNPLFRSIIVFVAICISFSGDVSYLRYLLPFLVMQGFYPYKRGSISNKTIHRIYPITRRIL
ncbi:MAG TPA: O-antigen ligase family protein [Gammaproteobacteria bacterium]|nr:O-antigen ligase family protein [Gammaproteobacteria bacterium]